MKLKIINNPDNLLIEAENYFSVSFCKDLKNEKPGTYKESLVARYEIEKIKKTQLAEDVIYNFSSISHKENLVFIATSEKKIGIDIEVFKERDRNLLDTFTSEEYTILGGKNWNNFYLLWTAKESCIKLLDLKLDNMKNILLLDTEVSAQIISDIKFSTKSALIYDNKRITVYSGIESDIFYSIVN